MQENIEALSEIEGNLDLILKNDSNPEKIKRGKHLLDKSLLSFFLSETKAEINTIIDRKLAQKLYNLPRSKQIKENIQQIGLAELSLFTQKRFIGLHQISSFIHSKILHRKSQAFSRLFKYKFSFDSSSIVELPPSALKIFSQTKTNFLQMPKSKRNKLKAFCHKLLHSSESISRKSKSLLIHWKALLNRKNLRDISKRAAFFIETAFYISKYQKKLIFQAFQRIKNLLFLRRNAVERLKDLIYKNLSQTFSFFRVKTAGLNAEKITSSCWKIAFIIKILLQKRKIDVFQNLKKGLMRNWGYKVRNLLNIYQEIERKNIDFGFKYLLRHQLKSEVQKQGFEGNLKKLVNCLQGLITKKKYNAFLRIKTHSFKYNLRKIIRLYKHSMKNGLRQAFFKWRGNLIIKKIQKRNLTNKVKGKILLSFSRNESNLTLKNGFLRWKVRADKNLLKNTMDRFALTSKISFLTVYFRFRSLLAPEKQKLPLPSQPFSKKKLLSTIKLFLFFSSKQKSFKQASLQTLHLNLKTQKISSQTIKLLQSLLKAILIKKRALLLNLSLRKWKETSRNQDSKQLFYTILQKSTYAKVFEVFLRWKNAQDSKNPLKTTKLVVCLKNIAHKSLRRVLTGLNSCLNKGHNSQMKILRLLFERNTGQLQKAFNLWVNETISRKFLQGTMKKIAVLGSFNEIIKVSIKENLKSIVYKQENQIKRRLFMILGGLTHSAMKKAFESLKKGVIQAEMFNFLQAKALKTMLQYVKSNENTHYKAILYKFYEHFSNQKTFKAFNKILSEKQKEKNLPILYINRLPNKENTFNKGLLPNLRLINSIFRAFMREIAFSFNKLSILNKEAKRLLSKVLKKSERLLKEDIRKRLIKWYNEKNIHKIEKKNQITILSYQNINEILSNQWKILFTRSQNEKIQRKLIKKFIQSNLQRLKQAFFLWVTAKTHSQSLQSIKQRVILTIESFSNKNHKRLLKKILLKFSFHARKLQILLKNLRIPFEKVKKEAFLTLKMRGFIKGPFKLPALEKTLGKLVKTKKKALFCNLKAEIPESVMRKERVLKNGLNRASSALKAYFDQWRAFNRDYKAIKRLVLVNKAFEWLNQRVLVDFKLFLLENDDKKGILLSFLGLKLENRIKFKLLTAFLTWKQELIKGRSVDKRELTHKKAFSLLKISNLLYLQRISPLKASFEGFLKSNTYANQLKIGCFNQMQRKIRGLLHEKLLLWRIIIEKDLLQEKNKRIFIFFDQTNKLFFTQTHPIFYLNPQKQAFLKLLPGLIRRKSLLSQRNLLSMFYKHSLLKKSLLSMNNLLIKKIYLRKSLCFNRIKGFIEKNPFKVNSLVKSIGKIVDIQMKVPLELMKSLDEEGKFLKGFTMKKIVGCSINSIKYSFFHWKINALSQKQQEKLKKTLNFFEILENTLKNHIKPVFMLKDWLKVQQSVEKAFITGKKAHWRYFKEKIRCFNEKEAVFIEKILEIEGKLSIIKENLQKSLLERFKDNYIRNKRIFGLFDLISKGFDYNIKKTFNIWKLFTPNNKETPIKMIKLVNSIEKTALKAILPTLSLLKQTKYIKKAIIKDFFNEKGFQLHKSLMFSFYLWRNESSKEKTFNLHRKMLYFYETLNKCFIKTIDPLIKGIEGDIKGEELKSRIMKRLMRNYKGKLSESMDKWRNFKKIEVLKDFFIEKLKKKGLERLKIGLLGRGNKELGFLMEKFNKNALRKKNLVKIYEKIIDKRLFLLIKEAWRLLKQEKPLDIRLLHLKSTIFGLLDKRFLQSFSLLKDFSFNGAILKERSLIKLVERAFNKEKEMFLQWKNWVLVNKNNSLFRKTLLSFEGVNNVFSSNISLILNDEKGALEEKKRVLQRISDIFSLKHRENLNKWRNKGILTQKDHKERVKKALHISKMNSLSIELLNFKLKKVLYSFFLNGQRTKMIETLFNRIKKVKSYRIYKSFEVWKELQGKRPSEYEKPSSLLKTERIFKKICLFSLKKSFSSMRKTLNLGRNLKITSSKRLEKSLLDKRRVSFQHWLHISHDIKTLSLLKAVISLYDILHLKVTSNISPLFQDSKLLDEKKMKILRFGALSWGRRLRDVMLIWLGNAQMMRVKGENDLDRMGFFIRRIEEYVKMREKSGMIEVMRRFKGNSERNNLISDFYNLLLINKKANIGKTFRIWLNYGEIQRLSLHKAKEKGYLLEKTLYQVIRAPYSLPFATMKALYQQGDFSKEKNLVLLANKANELLMQRFLHWKESNLYNKHSKLIRKILLSFENLKEVFNSTIEDIFMVKGGVSNGIKARCLEKLLKRREIKGKRGGFEIWKGLVIEKTTKEGLLSMKTRAFVKIIDVIIKGSDRKGLKTGLEALKQKGEFIRKILGMVEVINRQKMMKMLRLFTLLKKERKFDFNQFIHLIYKKKSLLLKETFMDFKAHSYISLNLKEKSLNLADSHLKRSKKQAFNHWTLENRFLKEAKTKKEIGLFFVNCNEALLENALNPLFKKLDPYSKNKGKKLISSIEKLTKRKLNKCMGPVLKATLLSRTMDLKGISIKRLIDNQKNSLKNCLYIWKTNINALKTINKLKSLFLIATSLENTQNSKLSSILRKFYDNSSKIKHFKNITIPLIEFHNKSLIFSCFLSIKHSLTMKITPKSPIKAISTIETLLETHRKLTMMHSFQKLIRFKSSIIGSKNKSTLPRLLLSLLLKRQSNVMKSLFHYSEISIVKHYVNALWKWKLANMESRYYVLMQKRIKDLVILSSFLRSSQAFSLRTQKASFERLKRPISLLKSVFSNGNWGIILDKTRGFLRWRTNALSLSKEMLFSLNSIQNRRNSIIPLLKRKKTVLMTLAFRKWRLLINITKGLVRTLLKILMKTRKNLFSDFKTRVFFQKSTSNILEGLLLLEKIEKRRLKEGLYTIKAFLERNKRKKEALHSILKFTIKSLYRAFFLKIQYKSSLSRSLLFERMKLLFPLVLSHRKRLLQEAFSIWNQHKIKQKLTKLVFIYSQKLKLSLQRTFDSILEASNLKKTNSRLKALLSMLYLSRNMDKYRLSSAFSQWKESDPNQRNPWFSKAIGILAKDSMLNPQIGFWRMRDFRKEDKKWLSAPKIVKLKIMVNNLVKAYEMAISDAFWRIERMYKIKENDYAAFRNEGVENLAIKKIKYKLLRDICSKYDVKHVIMKEAFGRLKNELPLMKRINTNDIVHLFGEQQSRNIRIIGAAFQMLFTLNKLFSNFSIKSLSSALKRLGNCRINEAFHSPVLSPVLGGLNHQNEGNLKEIEHLKKIVGTSNELQCKEEELNAAQECIEMIHYKLKSILVKRMGEIISKEVALRLKDGWNAII